MSDKDFFNFSNTQLVIERCLTWHIVHSPPSSYIANNIAACVVNAILAIAGTILNSLVVFSFYKSAKLRRRVCHFATMVLCSTDLAVVTVVCPMYAYKLISEVLGTPSCVYISIYGFFSLSISGSSFLNLFLTNVERYLSIVHPIWHHLHVTKRRFLTCCVCFWFGTLAPSILLISWRFIQRVFLSILIGTLSCGTIYVYVSIFLVARKRLGNIKRQSLADGQETTRSHIVLLRELKLVKTYFLIVALSFICSVPFGFFSARESIRYQPGEKHINLAELYGTPWGHTFFLMQSTLNCLVFFWQNRELRKEAFTIIKKCFSCGKNR